MKDKTQTRDEVLNTGLIILATRKYHKLHQGDFAAILGITQGTISKFENQLMAVELSVWFKFVKTFNIKDPACFIDMQLEYNGKVFDSLRTEGSSLAPKFDFKNAEYVCTIQTLWPIFEHIEKNNAIEDFFKFHKIQPEIFTIKNHPLPKDFVEAFFSYLKEIKISDEALSYIVPGFNKEAVLNPKQQVNLKVAV